MKEMPLVTVVIPAYNCEPYLRECVESIENQTYQNIEIIICDDCSTDNTYVEMKRLKKQYSNIIILRNITNQKAGKTRNICLEQSNGEFILLQDADDYSTPDRVETLIKMINIKSNIDYISSGMYKFDEKGIWSTLTFKERIITNIDIVKGCPVAHAATMFRRSALTNINGYRVDKETIRLEDYDLFYRLYLNNSTGYVIAKPLYYYREDQNAFSRKKYIYRIDEFKIRKKYFFRMNVPFKYFIYVFKPLIVGLIPIPILRFINKKRGNLTR